MNLFADIVLNFVIFLQNGFSILFFELLVATPALKNVTALPNKDAPGNWDSDHSIDQGQSSSSDDNDDKFPPDDITNATLIKEHVKNKTEVCASVKINLYLELL